MAIYMTGVTTQTVAGDPLPIAYGGTGQATAAAAINALLPLQTDNTDKVLKTDGVNVSWATVSSGGGAVTSVAGKTGVVTLVKADVGLGNVDNISDIDKPVSTAQQTALNLKANINSPTFTGTVSGITAAMVGAPAGTGTSSGTNTGDETATTIRSKLSITTLSGSNTGDQTSVTGNAGTATSLSAGADRTKLDSIEASANNYTHPVNHPASIITQDASNRFVTDAEKTAWNAKQPAGTYATGTGSASGTNTGDNATNTTYANDYRAANFAAGTNYLAPAAIGSTVQAYNASTVLSSGSYSWSGVQTFTVAQETRVAMGANAINQSTGNYFTKTISGSTTLTVSNTPAAGTTSSFILELSNGGLYTVTWWAGMKWAYGIAPSLTVSGVDILGFYTHDGGATWRGSLLAKDSK